MKIFTLLIAVPGIAFAGEQPGGSGLSKGLTNLCNPKAIEAKRARLKSALENPKVVGTCKQLLEKAEKECFSEVSAEGLPEVETTAGDSGEEVPTSGARASALTGIKAHEMGRRRSAARAQKCENQREAVRECREMARGLQRAMSDNERMRSENVSAVPDGPHRMNQIIDINNRHREVGQELRDQFIYTERAYQAADSPLSDWATCNANQALIYAQAEQQSQTILASVSNGEPPPKVESNPSEIEDQESGRQSAIKNTVQATVDGAKPVAQGMFKEGTTAAKVVGQAGKAVGGVFAAASVFEVDALGAVTGGAATAGEYLMNPANAMRFSGAMTAVSLIMDPTPTSRCQELFTDAVRAYNAGCNVYQPMSVQANEAAISTLSSR